MVLQRAKGAVCGSASLGQREYNLAICKLARVNLFSQVVWLVRRFAFINIHFFLSGRRGAADEVHNLAQPNASRRSSTYSEAALRSSASRFFAFSLSVSIF